MEENLNPSEQAEDRLTLCKPVAKVTETPAEPKETTEVPAEEEHQTTEENLPPTEQAEDCLTLRKPEEEITEAPTEEEPQTAEPAEEAPAEDPPAEESEAPKEELPPRKPRVRRGTWVFLGTLLGFVLCALILLICVMSPLQSFLEQYEDSQPEYVRDEVYGHLFEDPDWALLYDLAGVECTIFEGKDAFVDYMEQKVGDRKLVCQETSAGLSGDRKYILTCGDKKIASFTLTPDNAQFTTWTLSGAEVFFTPSESVTITKAPEHTVYINGIPLDDSYTTMSVEMLAEKYLPEGAHGYRLEQQQIEGLLFTPEVVVLDEYNNPVSVFYSEETGIYSTTIPTPPEMTDAEYALIVEAAKANALFSIRAINTSELREHFDPNSQVYADLCDTVAIRESYKSYKFDEDSISVTDFYRYSDDLFSVHVKLNMNVKIKKNEEFTHTIDTTYFFTKSNNGTYLVTGRTDEDLLQKISMYHLTFMYDDAVLETVRVPVDAVSINAPTTVAEGGSTVQIWARMRSDGTLIPVLELQADGSYFLTLGQDLHAMTLHPLFAELTE